MNTFLKDIVTGKSKSFTAACLKPLLWVLSMLYGGIIFLRRFLYRCQVIRSVKAQKPVISVGNITAGGVGKTPLVIFLAQYLLAKGKRPVILTRGYMNVSSAGQKSDEAHMMVEKLKSVSVMVGPDRVRSVRLAEAENTADVFIMDDGFQHLRLKRDLDIVAIDATNPFGNGHLLPRGILREPLNALKAADIFVLTRTDLAQNRVPEIIRKLQKINPYALLVQTAHAPSQVMDLSTGETESLDSLKGRVVVCCAIGSPEAFVETLKSLGAEVHKLFSFDDHHVYSAQEIRDMARYCQENRITKIVTTHKDAVKIRGFLSDLTGVRVLVLDIDIKVLHGEAEFFSRIHRLLYP